MCGVCQLQNLIDEMKISMHRMIARHLVCFSSNASTLILMLISWGIQCFVSKWYLANHGAKDELKGELRLVSRFKGLFFTPKHHLVVITLPQFQSMHMCELQTKHFSTYVGGANTTISGLWYLSKIIYTWYNCLGKQHEFKKA